MTGLALTGMRSVVVASPNAALRPAPSRAPPRWSFEFVTNSFYATFSHKLKDHAFSWKRDVPVGSSRKTAETCLPMRSSMTCRKGMAAELTAGKNISLKAKLIIDLAKYFGYNQH